MQCWALGLRRRVQHAGAEAGYRDVLAAKLRVLGPDHPSILITKSFLSE
jgi:hypothetical protein